MGGDRATGDSVAKRSVAIAGHPTSVSLEGAFWDALAALAARDGLPVARLVERIDADRAPGTNLSSAIRVYVLRRVMAAAGDPPP
jgi:predicted DNA-binding ribbon-helix-helix protein